MHITARWTRKFTALAAGGRCGRLKVDSFKASRGNIIAHNVHTLLQLEFGIILLHIINKVFNPK